ncbi:hypothetical protein FQN50_009136 [Emmonsiellopsis sp. PD_5]|nr:hypothetical protein FQN50_009136 [Emmonsiellopsis sp. PD_5]
MYRACQAIKNINTSAGKQITVAYGRHLGTHPETVKVALKEAEHPSQNDPARHFTVFELDKDEKVVASKHYYK